MTRDANRLTEDDRDTMTLAMLAAVASGTTDPADLVTVGLRAIGCTRADMRDSEITETSLTATLALAAARS